MSMQVLDTLEDGADVYNIINRLTPVMPTGNWSHGVTYDSIIFPDEYEKPPRDQFEQELQKLIEKKPFKNIRIRRNQLLRDCDWVLMPDVSMTEEVKQAWLAYRQALRDLPANTTDPENPIWPQAPTP